MKILVAGIAVAALTLVGQPAWSQSNSQQLSQNTQNNAPGTGGTSKPGTPGVPGSKSGPAAKPSGAAGADESGVKGVPGSKSGKCTLLAPRQRYMMPSRMNDMPTAVIRIASRGALRSGR